jgi:hypothetical protein
MDSLQPNNTMDENTTQTPSVSFTNTIVEDARKRGFYGSAFVNHKQQGAFGGRPKTTRAKSMLSKMVVDGRVVDRRED